MSELVWKDPPPNRGGRTGFTKHFVAQLKERPGVWALYPNTVASASTTSTYHKNYPDVEWTVRRRDDGRYDLYGRWIGGAA